MWLSRQMKAPAPTADADLGMTTITGDSVGVVTRGGGTGASGVWPRRLCVDAGERRCGTGYQRWPWRGGAVRGRTAAGFDPGRHGTGEVYLFTPGGNSVYLRSGGEIELRGKVRIQGSLTVNGEPYAPCES